MSDLLELLRLALALVLALIFAHFFMLAPKFVIVAVIAFFVFAAILDL